MAAFHLLDGFQQLAGLLQQAQAGQIGQQPVQYPLDVARGHDLLRVAAAGQGHIEQRLRGPAPRAGRARPPRTPCWSPRKTARSTRCAGSSQAARASVDSTRSMAARIERAASAVSTQVAMICSSSVSLMLLRRSYSTSDSCVPRGAAIGNDRPPAAIRPAAGCWCGPGPARRPTRDSRSPPPAAVPRAEAAVFQNWATVLRKASRSAIRLASCVSSKSVHGVVAAERLAFVAVVGAVAKGHVFIGCGEQLLRGIVLVVAGFLGILDLVEVFRSSSSFLNGRRPRRSRRQAPAPARRQYSSALASI